MPLRRKILDRAHELFVQEGIRNVTMDELAHSLGMSKRTIYEQFSDKRELVMEDAVSFALAIKQESERLLRSSENVVQGMTRVVQYIKGMIQAVTPNYFADMRKFYPSAYESIAGKGKVRNFSLTNEMVSRGVEEGIFRNDINIPLVSFFMNNTLLDNHAEMREIAGLKFGDYEKDVLFTYLLGLSTEKGRRLIKEEQAKYLESMTRLGAEVPRFKL